MGHIGFLRTLLGVGALLVGLVACASPGTSPSASQAATASTGASAMAGAIQVTLQEWSVIPAVDSAPAGSVTFQVTNNGPADTHEFVVIKTDLDPGDLPTDEHGAVDEAGEGIEAIGEIEDIVVGDTQELSVDLDAGKYVLICNIYDADEDEAHYHQGMRTAFTVTD